MPTHRFIQYQCKVWVPWFIQRYVFWNKKAELKPLYQFEEGIVQDIKEGKKEAEVRRASVVAGDEKV